METLILKVSAPARRLDRFLAGALPHLSRSRLQALIRDGRVTIDGRTPRANSEVNAGETIRLEVPDPPRAAASAEAIPLDVLYQDADILVINKPAGMVVHPAPGHHAGTLVNAILGADRELAELDAVRPGIVHRLDRDTSGVMVVARHEAASQHLVAAFAARHVEKRYLALVRGDLRPDQGAIDAPIGRDPRNRLRMAVTHRGRPARTEYRVIERLPGATLIECQPVTGRTHQIRVHLASIGHPIVGDAVYGQTEPGLARQFLHATSLRFQLPSGERRQFAAPLPAELARYLERARSGG